MLAILETILFSLYFLVPFLDCYRNVMVNINGVTEKSREIQNAGVSIRKLLSFFEIPYGNVDWKEQIGLNIGPVLMFSLCIALGLCLFHRIHKRELLVMSMLVVTLVLSTKYFPWDKIRTIRFIGNVLTQIQFPWRYLGYASLFGVVLFIFLMQRVSKKRLPLTVGAVLLVSLFMMLYFTKDYNAYAEYKTFKTTQDLDSSDMGFCEYLRVGTDRDEFTGEIKKTDKVESAEIVDRSGNTMVAAIDTNEGGYVELPVINYKGYQCRDENGQILTTTDGNNNLIRVTFAEEYHGKIYIAYVQPLSWILAEWISFVGYVLVLFWRICSVRKAGKQKIKYTSEQVI